MPLRRRAERFKMGPLIPQLIAGASPFLHLLLLLRLQQHLQCGIGMCTLFCSCLDTALSRSGCSQLGAPSRRALAGIACGDGIGLP